MAINPDNVTTVRYDQLPALDLTLTSIIAHAVASEGVSELKQATVQELVDLVSTAIGTMAGVGFLPISVVNGQQLPDLPTLPSFFLCGAGTYLNVGGFPDVICTGDLNAVMSLSDRWAVAVEIPISGGGGSGGVQSVDGPTVDNTDPDNPIVETPDLQQVLTEGGTVIEGANELYLDVASAVFSYATPETSFNFSDGVDGEIGKVNQSDASKIGVVRVKTTGEVELQQDNSAGSTKVTIEQPIATTEWQVPAKTAGTYKFASEEYVTAQLVNRIKVLARSGTSGSPITGTTAETQVLQLFIPANTLTTSDWITVGRLNFNKTTNVSTCTVRVKISTSATLPSGTTGRMATYTSSSSIQGFAMVRKFWQEGGNLKGVSGSVSYLTDGAVSTNGNSASQVFDPTVDNYLYVSIQNTSSSESVFLESYEITN